MKQKDIAIVIVVAFVSAVLSYFAASMLFGGDKKYTLKTPVVEPIASEFSAPAADDPYLNKNSINPTKNITIGDSSNSTPFKQNQ